MSSPAEKPWSVVKFLFYLVAVLAGGLLIWDKAATPGMKAVASQWGDAWVATGRLAGNLQATPWLENLGLVDGHQLIRVVTEEKHCADRYVMAAGKDAVHYRLNRVTRIDPTIVHCIYKETWK